MEILKVSSSSNPNSVAGALAGVIRDNDCAEVQAIGAGALNQAIKAIAIARGYVAPGGYDLVCVPAFTEDFPYTASEKDTKGFCPEKCLR